MPPDRPLPSQSGCALPPDGWHCTRDVGHSGPCAAIPDGDGTLIVVLEGNEPAGLLAVTRWLRDGLHLLLNDGPTRRAVDKLHEALERARHG